MSGAQSIEQLVSLQTLAKVIDAVRQIPDVSFDFSNGNFPREYDTMTGSQIAGAGFLYGCASLHKPELGIYRGLIDISKGLGTPQLMDFERKKDKYLLKSGFILFSRWTSDEHQQLYCARQEQVLKILAEVFSQRADTKSI